MNGFPSFLRERESITGPFSLPANSMSTTRKAGCELHIFMQLFGPAHIARCLMTSKKAHHLSLQTMRLLKT